MIPKISPDSLPYVGYSIFDHDASRLSFDNKTGLRFSDVTPGFDIANDVINHQTFAHVVQRYDGFAPLLTHGLVVVVEKDSRFHGFPL
jgi:hypothetical protein